MAYIGKKFTYDKHENFDTFLGKLGLSAEYCEAALKSKPSQVVTKDGDTYTITTIDEKGTKEVKFVSGVEFDETLSDGLVSKTTFTVGGNVITQVQKFGDERTLTIKREFDGDSLLVSLTSDNWDGVSRRYYKA